MKKYAGAIIIAAVISAAATFFARYYAGLYAQMAFVACPAADLASKIFLSVLLGGALTCVGCALYFSWLKTAYAVIIYVLTFVFTLVETFCILRFRMYISWYLIEIIASTNRGEATSFIQSYVGFNEAAMLLCFIFCGVFIWKSKDAITSLCVNHKKITASIIIVPVCISYALEGNIAGSSNEKALPIYGLYKAISSYSANRRCLALLKRNKAKTQKITYTSNDLPEVVCLIIGESESRHYMGVYNSEYNSTPLAQKHVKLGNLFAFNDVISPQGLTLLVIPRIISFINNEKILEDTSKYNVSLENRISALKGKNYTGDDENAVLPALAGHINDKQVDDNDIQRYDSIADILNKCGYQSFWLTNHRGSRVNYITHVRKSCKHDFMPYAKPTDKQKTDDCLLPVFDEYLKNEAPKSGKNFFVFHIYGSHFKYNERYPSRFDKFKANDIVKNGFSEAQKKTISEYINSILFTDSLQNEIIERVKNKDAVIIYVSDHAEELYVPTGFLGHRPTDLTKPMVEIPMFIYVSDIYKAKRPAIAKHIKNAVNKPYMTDDLIHTILDLVGVKTTCYDPTRSIINDKFIARERKIDGKSYKSFL